MSTVACIPFRFLVTLIIGTFLLTSCSSSSDSQSPTSTTLPEQVQASLDLVADKTFSISWQPSTDAEFYRVLENADGVSGFTQISDDLDASTQRFDHRVALHTRVNASYIVQACNAAGCVDSDEQMVVGTLDGAIGYFKASNTDAVDQFGVSVSISADGNTLAVGAFNEGSASTGVNGNESDNSAFLSGAVYVFARIGGSWQQQAYVKASNAGVDDRFGYAISLSADGDTLAVGAYDEDSAATGLNGNQSDDSARNAGAAYVFTRSNGNWQQQAYLKASNADAFDTFGFAVSLSADGNTLAVGAFRESSGATAPNGNQSDNSVASSGAVYLFSRSNNNWQQHTYLKASDAESSDEFGYALSLSANGNTLAVGAIGGAGGAVYVFERSNANWQQQENLMGEQFGLGFAVSLSADGNTLAASSLAESKAFVFERSNGDWQRQATLLASNADENDRFGFSISLSADSNTLVVGASAERSIATGVNGDQNDNSRPDSGAVYVFARGSGDWQQQAYLKAGDTHGGKVFGIAVSLSADGETLAVGANGENSAATGINGNQSDYSAESAGAVFLF